MGLSLEDFPTGAKRQGLPCSVASLLASLHDDDRAVLEAVLADWSIGHNAVERTLKDKGMRVGTGAVGKHRRGSCRCGA